MTNNILCSRPFEIKELPVLCKRECILRICVIELRLILIHFKEMKVQEDARIELWYPEGKGLWRHFHYKRQLFSPLNIFRDDNPH